MKNTILIIALVIGTITSISAQNLNSYKYVLVPTKFDFLKEKDQYQLNELTKFLFEKYNFKVIMEGGEMPSDLAINNCMALYADVKDESKFFNTILKVVLKDCGKKVIFESQEGSSREKDFKVAYHEALREAFKSIGLLNYNYEPNLNSKNEELQVSLKLVEKKEPIKEVIKDKELEEVVVSAIPMQVTKVTPPTEDNVEEVVVTAIPQKLPEKTEVVQTKKENKKRYTLGNSEFYLKKTDFGFQLVQSEMEEVFAKLIKTTSEGHFIYTSISTNGIAFFDSYGNLNVEVLADNGDSTSIKTYKLKN
tara:strand:- start:19836 stop:20756 length:921 start_codon:yes stop_codon:yes gene_type:complete